MTHDHDPLARLVREAADQVQPRPALDAIRARTVTSPKESAMSVARTWILGGLGGAVATAAVIGGVWFATTNGDDPSPTPPLGSPSGTISTSPSPSTSTTTSPSDSAKPSSSATGGTGTASTTTPVYFAADAAGAPGGLALYREFLPLSSEDRLASALSNAISQDGAQDRDYRTLWPADTQLVDAQLSDEPGDGLITINLSGNLHDRPAGMTERAAGLAIEQLIYTAQGTIGQGRLPVQLLLDGKHSDTVLGVPTSEPLSNAPVLETLSHVNISTPAEGDAITGDTLDVTGVANSFEANVVIKLQRFEGTYVAFQEPIIADGYMGAKLFPFSHSFDISKVAPGTYTLSATTDDPSGQGKFYSDDKVITIK